MGVVIQRRGHAGADRRAARGPAREGRNGRGDRGLRRGDDHAVVPVTPTRAPLVDVVGTGGDDAGTFNISTTAALVAAGAGAAVAKHGNRAASFGVWLGRRARAARDRTRAAARRIARSIDEHGFGFMFARVHHPAMRHAAPVRQEAGHARCSTSSAPSRTRRVRATGCSASTPRRSPGRTPRRSPVSARVGRWSSTATAASTLSPSGPSLVVEVDAGEIREWELDPRSLGIYPSPGGDPGRRRAGQRRGRKARSGGRTKRAAGRSRAECRRGDPRRGARRRPGRGRRGGGGHLDSGAAAATLERLVAFSLEEVYDLMGRFEAALRRPGLGAIAEIKRRSPSAGDLRPDADPARIAPAYAAAGAAAISVLVDERFAGSWDDLRAARAATDAPLLAKGFFSTPDDLRTAKRAGADAVLLLLRDLDDATTTALMDEASRLGLDTLVEAHDRPTSAQSRSRRRSSASTRETLPRSRSIGQPSSRAPSRRFRATAS